MKYSVIIPFHSNVNLLTMCTTALTQVLDPFDSEIIIVDNNATGSQINQQLKKDRRFRVITREENLMYPSAINLGVSYASGKYLIFCDADTYVTDGFHLALAKALEEESIGYTSAKLLNMQTNCIQEFGITSSYYNFPHPFAGRPQNFDLVTKNHSPLAACAACSAIRRNLFIDVGGFDKELLHSYSDIDLCIRLAAQGYKTLCVADSKAYHCGSSTVGSGMSSSLKEDTKGIFLAKNPHIPPQILHYLDIACHYFLSLNSLRTKDYFVLDCSTIGNSEMYIDAVLDALALKETLRHQLPYCQRDAQQIDFLNFIPHTIRNYNIPIIYFVDSFLSFRGNSLWKACRAEYDDIVLDRNANIELLRQIV